MSQTRKCGDCSLCCKLLPLTTIGKRMGEQCRHHDRKNGCELFGKFGRPLSCRDWSCAWLIGVGPDRRPDRAGYFVDLTPDVVKFQELAKPVRALQVWVDPRRAYPHRDLALCAFITEVARSMEIVAVIRAGSTTTVLVPPRLSHNGEWIEIPSQDMPRHEIAAAHREIAQAEIDRRMEAANVDADRDRDMAARDGGDPDTDRVPDAL